MSERMTMPAAVHVFVVRDGRILLLRRANTGYEDGNYSVPAGHLDGGETVLEAAAREAYEEAGIEIDPGRSSVVGVMHRRVDDAERIDFFIAATAWSGAIENREPEKCDELAWFAFAALPANVVPYVREAIGAYLRGEWFASFGWKDAGGETDPSPVGGSGAAPLRPSVRHALPRSGDIDAAR